MEKNISEYRTVQFYTRHVVYKKLTTISFLVQTSASIFTFSVNLTELRIILKKIGQRISARQPWRKSLDLPEERNMRASRNPTRVFIHFINYAKDFTERRFR